MGDLNTLLPTLFGLPGVRAFKERGYFLCKLKTGTLKIQKTNEHPQAIWARYRLLKAIEDAGFNFADKLYLSAQEAPFVLLGRETYIMLQHPVGAEPHLDSASDLKQAVETIALFHKVSREIPLHENFRLDAAPALQETIATDIAFLNKTTRQIEKNSRLSDFDVLFVKNLDKYLNYINQAAETLGAPAPEHELICHGNLKEENICLAGGNCHLTNFANTHLGLQLADFAFFLRRVALRSQKTVPLSELIEKYNQTNPIPQEQEKQLTALLTYPWQFIKLTRQYYSKKRGFIPSAILDRINALLTQQESYDQYVNSL